MSDKPIGARSTLVDATGRIKVAAEPTGIATACLELHGVGPEPPLSVFEIQLTVNVNIYPFVVLEGSISGTIYHVPGTRWAVTSGSFGPRLAIEAEMIPLSIETADAKALLSGPYGYTVSISGDFQAPDSYAGAYGFNGDTADFIHTTLFKGWQACS
jgi:hypothetical protein